jgi:hypothetical protein
MPSERFVEGLRIHGHDVKSTIHERPSSPAGGSPDLEHAIPPTERGATPEEALLELRPRPRGCVGRRMELGAACRGGMAIVAMEMETDEGRFSWSRDDVEDEVVLPGRCGGEPGIGEERFPPTPLVGTRFFEAGRGDVGRRAEIAVTDEQVAGAEVRDQRTDGVGIGGATEGGGPHPREDGRNGIARVEGSARRLERHHPRSREGGSQIGPERRDLRLEPGLHAWLAQGQREGAGGRRRATLHRRKCSAGPLARSAVQCVAMAFDAESLRTLLEAPASEVDAKAPELVDIDMDRKEPLAQRVLVIGLPLKSRDRWVVSDLQASMTHVRTLEEGLRALEAAMEDAAIPDVVVVDANVDGAGVGLRFVRQMKRADCTHLTADLAVMLQTYENVPFVIPPLGADVEYAVFTDASSWFLGRTDEVNFGKLLMHIRRLRGLTVLAEG